MTTERRSLFLPEKPALQSRHGTREIGCELVERTEYSEQAYHTDEIETIAVTAPGLPYGLSLKLQYRLQTLTLGVTAPNATDVATAFENRFA